MSQERGLHLLHEPLEREAAVVDIVFVHGLGGGHLSTWSENEVCWPRDLLKEDIPLARIYSYEYDSKVIRLAESTSRTSLGGHAESLLNELARERRQLIKLRPIIFICHSLGGLVVKQALIRSSEYYHNQQPHHLILGSILKSTLGVIFLGTPHRGSSKAEIGGLAAKAGKILGASDKLLKALERDSELLEQQRNSFDSIRETLYIVCLWEERPITGFGMIVPESSAVIDGRDVLKEMIPGSDHRSMARFSSRTRKGYKIVVDYLNTCLGIQVSTRAAAAETSSRSKLKSDVTHITNQCILQSLHFSELAQRHAMITEAHRSLVDAHKSTFDWVFAKPGPGFADWLEGSNGLFWINGKAGSGKSTLMKFIASNPRLHLSLSISPLPCLIGKFFFWAAGTRDQRSQQGLYRTLLYQLLSKRTDMIRTLYADAWDALYDAALEIYEGEQAQIKRNMALRDISQMMAHSSQVINRSVDKLTALADLKWTTSEMRAHTGRLLADDLKGFSVFLLVDGLDELEGSDDDFEDLISHILSWAKLPGVKICVSTRPWTIFEASFNRFGTPSFRLQDLTSDDISMYVSESFDKSPMMRLLREANPHRIPDLYSSIVAKAEGVFLWVRLVVKSLIDGLRNGDELSVLQERVDELPADLKRLYWHMIQRVPFRYWTTSSRMFKLVQMSEEAPKSLMLWYVGERGYSPVERPELSDATKMARCYQVHLRLMSQCAGLLEVRTAAQSADAAASTVTDDEADLMQPDDAWSFSIQQHYIHSSVHYLHRTTRDFFEQEEMQQLVGERLAGSSFDGWAWLATHSLVALGEVHLRLKIIPGIDVWDTFGFELAAKVRRFEQYLAKISCKEVVDELSSAAAEDLDNPERLSAKAELVLSRIDSI